MERLFYAFGIFFFLEQLNINNWISWLGISGYFFILFCVWAIKQLLKRVERTKQVQLPPITPEV